MVYGTESRSSMYVAIHTLPNCCSTAWCLLIRQPTPPALLHVQGHMLMEMGATGNAIAALMAAQTTFMLLHPDADHAQTEAFLRKAQAELPASTQQQPRRRKRKKKGKDKGDDESEG